MLVFRASYPGEHPKKYSRESLKQHGREGAMRLPKSFQAGRPKESPVRAVVESETDTTKHQIDNALRE